MSAAPHVLKPIGHVASSSSIASETSRKNSPAQSASGTSLKAAADVEGVAGRRAAVAPAATQQAPPLAPPAATKVQRDKSSEFKGEFRAQRDSDADQSKSPKKKKKRYITANLHGTRYDVVKSVVESSGFNVSKTDDPTCFLIWNDSHVATERIAELKPYQRINHFPAMGEICRKDALARNIAKMAKVYPEEYDFVPRTWILPQEYGALQSYYKDTKKKKKSKIFIYKPSNGAQGQGIYLYANVEKIPQSVESAVVQEYLDRPFLVDGFKCDLRIYVLVTSCDPLKAFLFNDGLVRLSTEKYTAPTAQNLDALFMHLTNYSINKHSDGYEKGATFDTGSKRSLKFLNEYLKRSDVDVAQLWGSIVDVIIKTLIAGLPHVLHAYRMCRPGQSAGGGGESVCFEILGFDVILDRKLKPWLLEINRAPSFGTNEKIDYEIKSALLYDTLKLINIRASDKKKNLAAQKAAAQKRLLQPRGGRLNESDGMDADRKVSIGRRKEELREMLAKIRRDNAREEFDNRNSGRFRRIFPPDDRFRQEKYARIMVDAFSSLATTSKNPAVQKEIERQYVKKYREDEILDMLAQCEADETEGVVAARPPRGPPPLTGLPSSSQGSRRPRRGGRQGHGGGGGGEGATTDENDDDDPENDDSSDSDDGGGGGALLTSRSVGHLGASRPTTKEGGGSLAGRPLSGRPSSGATMLTAALSRPSSAPRSRPPSRGDSDAVVAKAVSDREERLTEAILASLHEMRIKFPGKRDDEAEAILNELQENWKFHKPRIASYWLVKLDSIKRRKVVDIVRSNVRAKVQAAFQTHDVDSLRLYRIFGRVFNRLLWSHGQGLWSCFTAPGNAWETIFSKSTDVISAVEMACCRRIVQLCQDCLLIVYEFASEAKSARPQETDDGSNNPKLLDMSTAAKPLLPQPPPPAGAYGGGGGGATAAAASLGGIEWKAAGSLSQRYARLYAVSGGSSKVAT